MLAIPDLRDTGGIARGKKISIQTNYLQHEFSPISPSSLIIKLINVDWN